MPMLAPSITRGARRAPRAGGEVRPPQGPPDIRAPAKKLDTCA